jgi:hypothetical protein
MNPTGRDHTRQTRRRSQMSQSTDNKNAPPGSATQQQSPDHDPFRDFLIAGIDWIGGEAFLQQLSPKYHDLGTLGVGTLLVLLLQAIVWRIARTINGKRI